MLGKIGIAAIASLSASAAMAQSLPAGVSVTGFVQAEYLFDADDGDSAFIADLLLDYNGAAAGGMPIGFELGVIAVESDFGFTDTAFYGSVYYDATFGRISVGTPRTALDDYIDVPSFGQMGMPTELDVFFGSYTDLVALDGDFTVYGIRFDGSSGDIDYGVSVHSVEGEDFTTVTAAASYDVGNYTLAGGIEYSADAPQTGYLASVTADFDPLSVRLMVSSPMLFGEVFYSLSGEYALANNLVISAQYIDGADLISAFYSVGAEYTFMENAYVGASVMDSTDAFDTFYNVYAGWNVNFGG